MTYGSPGSNRRVAGSRRSRTAQPPKQPPERQRGRKRVIVWVGGIATAGLGTLIAAIMTGLGNAAVAHITSPQAAAATGSPVKLDLVTLQPELGDTHVLAQPLVLSASQLGGLNDLDQGTPAYEAWFAAHGAVDAGQTRIEIVLEGNRTEPVRIIDMQPVTTCSAPLNGTLFYSPPAGDDTSTQLFVNLDSPSSEPSYIASAPDGNITSGSDFFGTYTVSLKQAEQYTFNVVASTVSHYCSFTLAMTVLDAGHTVVENIDDNGKPFRVTAVIDPDPQDPGPGMFSAYRELYVGGVGNVGGGVNGFDEPLWAGADPATYGP